MRIAAVLLSACCLALGAGEAAPRPPGPRPEAKPARPQMDHGPALCHSVLSSLDGKTDNTTGGWTCDSVPRAIVVRLAAEHRAGLVFDMDCMRVYAGWTQGGLKLRGVSYGVEDRGPSPTLTAPPLFTTPAGPGCAGADGRWDDPRPDSIAPLPRPGPLPRAWARWRGHHLHGDRVVLDYELLGCRVLESPSLQGSGEGEALARTLRVAAGPALDIVLAAAPTDARVEGAHALAGGCALALAHAPAGAALAIAAGRVVLRLPARGAAASCTVLHAAAASAATLRATAAATPPPEDLELLCGGGPARWKDEIAAVGSRGADDGPYAIDTIALPTQNPWHARMRAGGFDFLDGGAAAALCTVEGDVWIVRGLDDQLQRLRWRRFATGLNTALGLKVVDGVIHVVGRDQVTRLIDRNGDGEADSYECLSNDWELTTAFHSFAFDLHTDRAGDFLFAFGAPVRGGGGGFQKITRHHGCVLKVAKDGSRVDAVVAGLRAPNGIGVSPEGWISAGDNQGSWVPRCPVHLWKAPGGFGTVKDTAQRDAADLVARPLCWLPMTVDNSGGGQAWAGDGRWGPFAGLMVHGSYGTCSAMVVLRQDAPGGPQGGVVQLPGSFESGAMRLRFGPHDGQLYVCGLKGWQTKARAPGCFQRMRWTGKPACMPIGLAFRRGAVELRFSDPLTRASATSAGNWTVEGWNYRWSEAYGSAEHPLRPKAAAAPPPDGKPKPGAKPANVRETLAVSGVELAADGRTVTLRVPDLCPADQIRVAWKIDAEARPGIAGELHGTIRELP